MDDDKSSATAPPSPRTGNPTAEIERQLFAVDLRPGETTIVSWNKLLKEDKKRAGSSIALSGTQPVVDSVAAPVSTVQPAEGEPKDAVAAPNRFSAVIEKIERLYMGKDSSDEEELDDIPDDDQYDTEDSFIDDAELNEYFQVEKLKTKHNGYFVNRGKLEGIEPSSSPNPAPKKRIRKDSAGLVNMGNMRIKDAARNAPLAGRQLPNPAKIPTHFGECYQDGRPKKESDFTTENYKKKSVKLENSSSVKKYNKDTLSIPLESKGDKCKSGAILSRDFAHKPRGLSESNNDVYQTSREKGAPFQAESHPKRLLNGENELEESTKKRHKERSNICGLVDLNSSGIVHPLQTAPSPSMQVKEGSVVRPKGTTFGRAIRDLERVVAEYRPPNLDIKEADTLPQAVKRRLPQEIKQKLAKVARLSATRGKISENELIDRLVSIVGHLVPRKTLKRNLREMVELGLSAKQQKAHRYKQIKKDIHEMIKAHVLLMKSKLAEQQIASTDDFQDINNDVQRALKGKFSMDKALEDKICELYDLYFEGMDEDKSPQKTTLHGQLAELWPDGYMNSHGVKDAIFRSRERRRATIRRQKIKEEERLKRKDLRPAIGGDELGLGAQVQSLHERPRNNDKDRGDPDDGGKNAVSNPKRKMKKKSESDFEEVGIPTQQQLKRKDESNVDPLPVVLSLQAPNS